MTDVGTVLAGKYRLVRLIGAGGMGGVFEAVNEQIGKPVAVKLLRPEFAFDGEMVVRFMREARAAAAIGHPCIVDVYDVGAAPDGALFMVMELLKGESLAHIVEQQPTLSPPLVIYGMCQVLSALDAAHRREVVHRDIKPANILIVDRGQALPDVKLLDFGVSKVLDPNRPGERLTKTGVPVGTPSYMSPEQVLGEKDVDGRTDIYAVGVVMYRCLTGKLPFKGDANEGVYFKIVKGGFAPPRSLRPEIPPALEHVITRAMAPRREARFQSASEMLSALMGFLDERAADRVVLPEGLVRRSAAPPSVSASSPPLADRSGGYAAVSGAYPAASGAYPAYGRTRPPESGAFLAAKRASAPGARKVGLALPLAVALGTLALLGLAVTFALARPWERAARARPADAGGALGAPALGAPGAELPASPPLEPGAGAPPRPADPMPTVELQVEVEPAGAQVRIDGVGVPGNPHVGRYPRDGAEHRVEALADGYVTREQRVRFDRDLTVSIQLQPERPEGRRNAPRAPEQPATSGVRPSGQLVPSPYFNRPRGPEPPSGVAPGLTANPF